jgi:hypothetical protein
MRCATVQRLEAVRVKAAVVNPQAAALEPAPLGLALSSLLPSWLPQALHTDDNISDLEFSNAVIVGVPASASRRRGMSVARSSRNLSSDVASSDILGAAQNSVRNRLTSFRPWMRENQGWDD